MKKRFGLLFTAFILNSSIVYASDSLDLTAAIEILKRENLEIKSASLELQSAKEDVKTASGNHWGKLDFIQDFANSDDAGNVFGFKLTSREATFGDFGFNEFLAQMPALIAGTPGAGEKVLATQPDDLNYPDSRNFFQSKLKYEVPIFTGFKISSYTDIMNAMMKMKTLEKKQVVNEKIYQIRKSFYDMALLKNSSENLNTILQNINTLELVTKNMIEVGYAKKVDLLEVKAKKGNVERLISQMDSNQKLLYHFISFLLNQKVTEIQTPSMDMPMPSYTNDDILNSNIDIKRANNGLEIRKSMVQLSEASYYPMIGAFAEVATADDSFLGEASDHTAYTVGARLTWNIFNGGIDSANVEKARLDFIKTKTEVQLANSGISLQIDKIKTEIDTYNHDIISLEKELALSDEIYKNYEGRYKEKLSSMSDVIIKQSEQIQKILQLNQARNKRNERIFALEKLANGEEK
ncbi:TolC family protein [Candidatus Sulfurimonas baltica]|uniref:TolC family protein n=1 Tax=Candidatus Sulfurimonas baltica TaxID=2740404 RepID=A0A7S7LTM2_9BACT|nr:TolC family protein [Candidatus Sulfurimonas baltica]QOY51065.1 TolC family protein [Candidatus Sulfurimonas baltica]